MSAYYNEIEPYAAQWLRNLIAKGLIADGEVDTRSIVDVAPDDLRAFTQCHFFAGIGGWSHALRLAGWPDDRAIWTGSCPCQPFSVAGKGAGTDDPRHLWPHFHRLITAVRPPVVMGEQVAGQAGYGWLDGVRADLEREGYASRGADLPALAVNAPHIRQRLYWVAIDVDYTASKRREHGELCRSDERTDAGVEGGRKETYAGRSLRDMAHADEGRRGRWPRDGDGERDGQAGERHEDHRQLAGGGEDCLDVADASLIKRDGGRCRDNLSQRRGVQEQTGASDSHMANLHQSGQLEPIDNGERAEGVGSPQPSRDSGFWSDHIWLTGSDGKSRRVEPSIPLLAYGIPNRVGRLRAYGNAIVPPLAAEVIKAFMETEA